MGNLGREGLMIVERGAFFLLSDELLVGIGTELDRG
jgi:hypothetical protein